VSWKLWENSQTFNREVGDYDFPIDAQPKERSHGATRLKTRRWEQVVYEGAEEQAPRILPAGRLSMRALFLATKPIGDLSNCIKSLEDALNRRAYHDDRAIDHIEAMRVYAPDYEGKTRILTRVFERK